MNLIVTIIFFVVVFYYNRIYQHRDESLHAHPQQLHSNGRLYNDKRGGIIVNPKANSLRNIAWTKKWQTAVFNARYFGSDIPSDLGQHGANGLETQHAGNTKYSHYMKKDQVHTPHFKSMWARQKFKCNTKRTYALKKKIQQFRKRQYQRQCQRQLKNQPQRQRQPQSQPQPQPQPQPQQQQQETNEWSELDINQITKMYNIHLKYNGVDALKHEIGQNNHMYLYFAHDRSHNEVFKGIFKFETHIISNYFIF